LRQIPIIAMKKARGIIFALAAATMLAACGMAADSGFLKAGADPAGVFEGPVPRAECGPGAAQESGIQGQVPASDQASGRAQSEYRCNMEVVGQFQGEGASWQHAWYGDCAYYDTANGDGQVHPGAVVVDVRDPANPLASAYLAETTMLDPWESLKVSPKRGLLAGVQNAGEGFAIYDVAKDCRYPILLADTNFAGTSGHEGDFAQDGLTYYGSDLNNGNYYPVDVSNPSEPSVLTIWPIPHATVDPIPTHGLSTNPDGSRVYITKMGLAPPNTDNGLIILDAGDVQARKPDPELRIISTLFWSDGSAAQHTVHFVKDGHPYILFSDENGKGAGRIIDIGDETAPRILAKLKLEVHMPENEAFVAPDASGGGPFVYEGHYCSVDRLVDPTAVACAYRSSGIRVFDIRDLSQPREIAYFIPPAQLGKSLPGSNHNGANGQQSVEQCTAQIRFVPERHELWTSCMDNGFLVLGFTNGVWPFP
jgi:hypothetical protein